jgi:DNA repair photolyase
VAELSRAGIETAVFAAPVLPWITDSRSGLEHLARSAAAAGAAHFNAMPLFLRPCSRAVFLPFIERHFPHLAEPYRCLYVRGSHLRGPEERRIGDLIGAVRSACPPACRAPEVEWGQLRLFSGQDA